MPGTKGAALGFEHILLRCHGFCACKELKVLDTMYLDVMVSIPGTHEHMQVLNSPYLNDLGSIPGTREHMYVLDSLYLLDVLGSMMGHGNNFNK